MALVRCSECSRQVSTRATACPGCGCPISPSTEAESPTAIEQVSRRAEAGHAPDKNSASEPPLEAVAQAAGASPSPAQHESSRPPERGSLWRSPRVAISLLAGCVIAIVLVARAYHRGESARRPTYVECHDAVIMLYRSLAWSLDEMTLKTSVGTSAEQCTQSAKLATVRCYLNREAEQARACPPLEGVTTETLDGGLYCFDTIDNTTGHRTVQGCAFYWQMCQGRKDNRTSQAKGITFEDCRPFNELFGVKSSENKKHPEWYGLTPSLQECYGFWRRNRGRLTNVLPGCRRIAQDHSDLGPVPEPPRMAPKSTKAPLQALHCYDSPLLGGQQCYANREACEAVAARYPGSDCAIPKQGYYHIDSDEEKYFGTLSECESTGQSRWLEGNEVTSCARIY